MEALDAEGPGRQRPGPDPGFRVSGGGTLLGVDNGDSTDTDEYKGTVKRLFGGKMLIILGKRKAEPARIERRTTGSPGQERMIPAAPGPAGGAAAASCRRSAPPEEKGDSGPAGGNHPAGAGCELSAGRRRRTFRWKIHPENAIPLS